MMRWVLGLSLGFADERNAFGEEAVLPFQT
jgi:hypothetical protein